MPAGSSSVTACNSARWAAETNEGELIAAALDKLEAFSGTRLRGWMSPGWSETFDTPDLLRQAGVEYVTQWVVDDVPTWLRTDHGPLVSLPYGLDLNDSVVYAIEKHSSPEMKLRFDQTIDVFTNEIRETGQVRVLTIPLHPHLSGVAHRFAYLCELIDGLRARDDTIFMNGAQILDWFLGEATVPDGMLAGHAQCCESHVATGPLALRDGLSVLLRTRC